MPLFNKIVWEILEYSYTHKLCFTAKWDNIVCKTLGNNKDFMLILIKN
jgi:hypothetical protein